MRRIQEFRRLTKTRDFHRDSPVPETLGFNFYDLGNERETKLSDCSVSVLSRNLLKVRTPKENNFSEKEN